MFCAKCGKELKEGSVFCPRCGTKVSNVSTESVDEEIHLQGKEEVEEDREEVIKEEKEVNDEVKNSNTTPQNKNTEAHQEPDMSEKQKNQTKNNSGKKTNNGVHIDLSNGQGLFNKIWTSEQFTNYAIRFDHLCDWGLIVILFLLTIKLFGEGGIWGVGFGILFLISLVLTVARIVKRFKKRKDFFDQNRICPTCGQMSTTSRFCSNCGARMPQLTARELEDENDLSDASLKAKKKKLLWAPLVIAIGIIVVSSGAVNILTGTEPISNTKNITIGGYKHSIGTWVSNNIKNGKWHKEKIDGDSYYVTVEGYCSDVGEDILIKFRYEDMGEHYQVKALSISLPESNTVYTDAISMAMIFGYLDD